MNKSYILFQRQDKYSVNKLKALHARNEYLLNIEVANAAIKKYFSDDVSDLMDVSAQCYFDRLKTRLVLTNLSLSTIFNPFPHVDAFFTSLQHRTFEDIVAKEEIACDEKCLLLPQGFKEEEHLPLVQKKVPVSSPLINGF